MDEKSLLNRIEDLVAEEHQLRAAVQAGSLSSAEEGARLREVEVSLDQCWDLLRRRRAARETGGDPNVVSERPAAEVESYLQ